jgi:hypothetical protein
MDLHSLKRLDLDLHKVSTNMKNFPCYFFRDDIDLL